MPVKETYLVRGPNGRMSTVVAQSHQGAVNIWLDEQPASLTGMVSAKPRGHGKWKDFEVK